MASRIQNPETIEAPHSGRSLFERALEALPDGVLITDASRKVVYMNRAFARHWDIPPVLLHDRDDMAMLRYVASQLVDAAAFQFGVERLHQTSESSEDEIRFKDGRIFSRRSVPFEEAAALVGRIWIFTDVTDARNAMVDSLTGLPNRRAFSRDFPGYAEGMDDGFLRSVAVMDVDNFKKFNDLYGHAAGDVVLSRIGRIIRAHFEDADDLVFRIGGEEFLMASKVRSAENALVFFDQVRRSVFEMGVAHAGNLPHSRVTVSLGLGTFRGPMEPGTVFDRVDAALYRAKLDGRNRTVPTSI
jgi:diguanylate cyclase (GGDEF)-like protein